MKYTLRQRLAAAIRAFKDPAQDFSQQSLIDFDMRGRVGIFRAAWFEGVLLPQIEVLMPEQAAAIERYLRGN